MSRMSTKAMVNRVKIESKKKGDNFYRPFLFLISNSEMSTVYFRIKN
jgi:uncharacterized protein YegL